MKKKTKILLSCALGAMVISTIALTTSCYSNAIITSTNNPEEVKSEEELANNSKTSFIKTTHYFDNNSKLETLYDGMALGLQTITTDIWATFKDKFKNEISNFLFGEPGWVIDIFKLDYLYIVFDPFKVNEEYNNDLRPNTCSISANILKISLNNFDTEFLDYTPAAMTTPAIQLKKYNNINTVDDLRKYVNQFPNEFIKTIVGTDSPILITNVDCRDDGWVIIELKEDYQNNIFPFVKDKYHFKLGKYLFINWFNFQNNPKTQIVDTNKLDILYQELKTLIESNQWGNAGNKINSEQEKILNYLGLKNATIGIYVNQDDFALIEINVGKDNIKLSNNDNPNYVLNGPSTLRLVFPNTKFYNPPIQQITMDQYDNFELEFYKFNNLDLKIDEIKKLIINNFNIKSEELSTPEISVSYGSDLKISFMIKNHHYQANSNEVPCEATFNNQGTLIDLTIRNYEPLIKCGPRINLTDEQLLSFQNIAQDIYEQYNKTTAYKIWNKHGIEIIKHALNLEDNDILYKLTTDSGTIFQLNTCAENTNQVGAKGAYLRTTLDGMNVYAYEIPTPNIQYFNLQDFYDQLTTKIENNVDQIHFDYWLQEYYSKNFYSPVQQIFYRVYKNVKNSQDLIYFFPLWAIIMNHLNSMD